MDVEVSLHRRIQFAPRIGFGPAFVSKVALATVLLTLPCTRDEVGGNDALDKGCRTENEV